MSILISVFSVGAQPRSQIGGSAPSQIVNAWFRRLLLILTIGGGFVGVVLTMQFFTKANKVIAYAMLLAFIALYGYGIFVGLKLSEGPTPLRYLRAYFIVQIPLISSPLVATGCCPRIPAHPERRSRDRR